MCIRDRYREDTYSKSFQRQITVIIYAIFKYKERKQKDTLHLPLPASFPAFINWNWNWNLLINKYNKMVLFLLWWLNRYVKTQQNINIFEEKNSEKISTVSNRLLFVVAFFVFAFAHQQPLETFAAAFIAWVNAASLKSLLFWPSH